MVTAVIITACTTAPPSVPTIQPTAQPIHTLTPTATNTVQPTSAPTAQQTTQPVNQQTNKPTHEPTNQPTALPTNTITPTPISACGERLPNDIYAIVTQTYGLSSEYEPDDLVSINDNLPYRATLGVPSRIRKLIMPVLAQMVDDMLAANLSPLVVSGYRSHYEQTIAYNKWAIEFPDWVDSISAKPGHSEHQLGTTVDFTSPELPAFTGDPNLQFHPDFARTSEGIWLAENAHSYGFTLSYPREAYEITGFNYEPWHFRYIGTELATRLEQLGISFTEYQLALNPTPCVPEEG